MPALVSLARPSLYESESLASSLYKSESLASETMPALLSRFAWVICYHGNSQPLLESIAV